MGDIDLEALDKAVDDLLIDTSARLVAALAELSRLRSVVAGVEALAEKWDAHAATAEQSAQARVGLSDHSDLKTYASIKRNAARRLRSVLSDTKGEAQ